MSEWSDLQTVVSVSQHYKNPTKCVDLVQRGRYYHNQGRIQDFKLGGAHLKKLRRAEGDANIFGVFRVKYHDFTPKNHIFSNFRGGGGGGGHAPGAPPPPLDPPLITSNVICSCHDIAEKLLIWG